MQEFQWMQLVYVAGLLLLIGPAAIALNRRGSVALRNIAIWLGIAVVAALAYRTFGP